MLSSSAAAHNFNYGDLDNILSQPETEHNWAAKENACKLIGNAAHPGIQHDHVFVTFVKNHRASLSSAIKTERTRLSGTACDMVEKIAKAMQGDFGPLLGEVFTGPLLQVCARTNKVMVTRAVKALQSTIDAGSLVCLPKACAEIASPNKTLRIACIGLVARSIDRFSTHELEPFVNVFEPVLKEGVSDAAPEVRDTSRKTFKAYASKFPERATSLMATMPANVLKYLQPDAKSASGTGPGSATGASTLSRTATGGITKSLPSGGAKASLGSRHHSAREMSLGGVSRIGTSARPVPTRAASVPAAVTGEHVGQSTLRSLMTSSSSTTTHHSSTTSPHAHHHHYHPQQQSQQQQQPPHHRLSHHGQYHPHDIPRNSLVERRPSVERTVSRSYGTTAARHPVHEHSESSLLSTTTSSSASGMSARPLGSRSRTLSGNSMTASAMMQRAPAINLAAHGGAQRVAPTGSSSQFSHISSTGSSSHGSINTSAFNTGARASGAVPATRSARASISGSSGHGAAPKERVMSASERAKAYSASLKLEMSQRRASDAKAAALRGRRAATESAEDHPASSLTHLPSRSGLTKSSMSDPANTMAREPWQGARSASPQLESYPSSSFDTILSEPDVGSIDIHHDESQQRHSEQAQHQPEQQQQQQPQDHATELEPHHEPSETEQSLQNVGTSREHGILSILTDANPAKHSTVGDRNGPLSGSSSVPSSVTSGSSAGSSCSSPASLTWSVASGILNHVSTPIIPEDHHDGNEDIGAEAHARFAKPWPDMDMIPEHRALFGSTETILRTEAEIAAFNRMQKDFATDACTAVQPEPEALDGHGDLDGSMGPAEMEAAYAEAVSSATDATNDTTASAAEMISTLENEHAEAHMMSDVEEHELDKPLGGDVEALLAMDESMDKGCRAVDDMEQAAVVQASVEYSGRIN
ncbi:hypothetical protein BGZ73_001249 [Actinomortierella ambigua]|nr:hypothetical protein BGZ73_001249 [Actinomortierella ambigua]